MWLLCVKSWIVCEKILTPGVQTLGLTVSFFTTLPDPDVLP